MKKLGIIIVIESGDLEQKARLLIDSIRTFGGEAKNSKIWAVKPRKGKSLSKETLNFLKEKNVEIIEKNLNTHWHMYGLANKIYATAYVEKKFGKDYETLLFLDSDTIVIDEIDVDILEGRYDVAIKPLDGEYLALKETDKISPFWEMIYKKCSVSTGKIWKVKTTVNHLDILAYFNSGVIFSNAGSSLFTKWLENFKLFSTDKRAYQLGHLEYYFLEQALLSGTILGCLPQNKVKILDNRFNYSINFHRQLENEEGNNKANIKIIHYHSSFYENWKENLPFISPELNSWLHQRLPLLKFEKTTFHKCHSVFRYVVWRISNKLFFLLKASLR